MYELCSNVCNCLSFPEHKTHRLCTGLWVSYSHLAPSNLITTFPTGRDSMLDNLYHKPSWGGLISNCFFRWLDG